VSRIAPFDGIQKSHFDFHDIINFGIILQFKFGEFSTENWVLYDNLHFTKIQWLEKNRVQILGSSFTEHPCFSFYHSFFLNSFIEYDFFLNYWITQILNIWFLFSLWFWIIHERIHVLGKDISTVVNNIKDSCFIKLQRFQWSEKSRYKSWVGNFS
jgi:hypothetical protein